MDSLDGMPEFTKPQEETIPLVVPDTTPEPHAEHFCHGLNKAGKRCRMPHQRGKLYCVPHDPEITKEQMQEWRKRPRKPKLLPMGRVSTPGAYFTREEILEILTKRLKVWMATFGEVLQPGVDDAICDLCRTYAAVAKVEIGEGVGEVRGWRIGRTG